MVLDESESAKCLKLFKKSCQPIRNRDSSPAPDEKREKKLRENA